LQKLFDFFLVLPKLMTKTKKLPREPIMFGVNVTEELIRGVGMIPKECAAAKPLESLVVDFVPSREIGLNNAELFSD
jgi:hypothetical protein